MTKTQRLIELMMTKHVIKPVTHIVGIECMTPFTAVYMANALIPKLWTELMERKHEIAHWHRWLIQRG